MNDVRVLLVSLSVRVSRSGKSYLTGYLGKSRLIGFQGQPEKYGNPTFDIFVSPATEPAPVRPQQQVVTIDA